jgi:hypothetical protein
VTRARLGALLLVLLTAAVVGGASPVRAQTPDDREAYVIESSGASLEDLLGVPALGGIAAFGGAALLVPSGVTLHEAVVALHDDGSARGGPPGDPIDGLTVNDVGSLSLRTSVDRDRIDAMADDVRTWLEGSTAGRVLVVIASGSPSPSNASKGDGLGAVIVASGRPGAIAAAMDATGARPGALTSDSTRRDGVVATSDISATVSSFLGVEAPGGDLGGHVIATTASEPPFALHERYLQQRRLYVPIGTAAAMYLVAGGLAACLALWQRRRVPIPALRALGWVSLSVAALGGAMLAAGHLPQLTYATVVPFIAIVAVFGTLWTSPLEGRDPSLVPMALGTIVLVAFVLEAATGWVGMMTPLLGGSQLDGGRFFGMPNVAIGLVLGGCLWAAHRGPTSRGVALLCAAALVAGLPLLGTNLGAGVTLFATAGLWWAIRERRRLGALPGLALVAGVTITGAAVILLAHALSPVPTHVTRFEETGGGSSGVLGTIADRLGTGFELLRGSPAAWIPVLGLVVTLVLIARPTPAIRAMFERWPAFRDATLVCALGGVVAYVANDTGAAACGLAFALALGGMIGMSLLDAAGKMARDDD